MRFWRPERSDPVSALLRVGSSWLEFKHPTAKLVANSSDQVLSVLQQVDAERDLGYWVMQMDFEAAQALDSAFPARGSGRSLLRASCYPSFETFDAIGAPRLTRFGLRWSHADELEHYIQRVDAIRDMIGDGRVYQVNQTMILSGETEGDPADMFAAIAFESEPAYGALLRWDDEAILSFSPELFFEVSGNTIRSKPMKGTRPADGSAIELAENPKDRAENLMIVDMIRNDLGRVAATGSVRVPKLFEVAAHGSVLQMTSTIEAELASPKITDWFTALFPCASVVGAPKVEAMKVLSETEPVARGPYCGAIGVAMPNGNAQFNVAIRTLVVEHGEARFGVGSGIVWDSEPQSEWQECRVKTRVLAPIEEPWHVLETLLWDPAQGFVFLEDHFERAQATLEKFGSRMNLDEVAATLLKHAVAWTQPMRVRLLWNPTSGDLDRLEASRFEPWPETVTAMLASHPLDAENPWLRHKTTRRGIYDRARAAQPEVHETLLWNHAREVAEFCFGNVVVEFAGEFWTPLLASGVLPGIARAHALQSGRVKERLIGLDELAQADTIWHVNSVRGWTQVKLASSASC